MDGIMVIFSPWLSLHCLRSFQAILRMLYSRLHIIYVKSLLRYFCGRLHKISHQILVKHINCHVQRENLVTFLYFRISQGSVATYCRWGGNLCVRTYRIFLWILLKKILKIGPYLPKLSSNIKGYTFFLDTVYIYLSSWTVMAHISPHYSSYSNTATQFENI